MNRVKIKDNIYWVGAVDWSLRDFHGYTTHRGSTYNAYLIIDEKIALIDTVKAPFTGELLERVSNIIDPSKIDYIICNHVESDHSGALPALLSHCPGAQVIAAAPRGVDGLRAHYGDFNFLPVKSSETLSLGAHTLNFLHTPMLHWPDNMLTYCPEEKLLFSNDAFGQHYATTGRFDDQVSLTEMLEEAEKYYANIVLPYSAQAHSALEAAASLDIEMIIPSHGVIWRSHIQSIIDSYKKWSSGETEERAVVVFGSMWHSTEKMARVVAEAFADAGVPAKLYDLKYSHMSDIMTEVLSSKYIAVGTPTLNNGMLPPVSAFLTYLKGLSPKKRSAFAFGSHGWGGQGSLHVQEALAACGFDIVLDRQTAKYVPSPQQLETLYNAVKGAVKA